MLYALPASGATIRPICKFNTLQLCFGIMTPAAAQRTSFQKNGRSDPRSVVDRHPLHIRDRTDQIGCGTRRHHQNRSGGNSISVPSNWLSSVNSCSR